MTTALTSRIFGYLPTGEAVEAWRFQAGRLEMEVLTYGGTITRLLVPDREGKLADIVLGYDALAPYLARHPFFGCITGRVAGRIAGAVFTLDGVEHRLDANEPPHHLHGGFKGLDQRLWVADPVVREDGAPSLRLSYHSPHGEEKYPGTVDFQVTYTLTAEAFVIDTEATTDRPTPINLTNHSYFNLAGEGTKDFFDHELCVYSDIYYPISESHALVDREERVAGSTEDLNEPCLLGEAVKRLEHGHGSLYRIRRADAASVGVELAPVARLVHAASGRVMEVASTERMVQLYTGMKLDPAAPVGKSGRAYGPFAGLCLECEDYSHGVAHPEIGDIVVRPGKSYRHQTVYRFSTC